MPNSIERLAERLSNTQEFCQIVEKHIEDNFIIEGKSMVEWKRHFYIQIPENLDFHAVVMLAADLWSKCQEVARYRDAQQVQLAIMEQSKSDKYLTEYNAIRASTQAESGRPLAADSCKVHATLAVKELDGAIGNQKVVHSFWVKTYDTLTEMRKLLEIIGYAVSADLKLNQEINIRGSHNDN